MLSVRLELASSVPPLGSESMRSPDLAPRISCGPSLCLRDDNCGSPFADQLDVCVGCMGLSDQRKPAQGGFPNIPSGCPTLS